MKMIPWQRVMGKVYKQEKKQRISKGRNHAEVLKRFRLTRFGWQRRRARLNGRRKRLRSYASKQNSKKIEFVHRSDMRMIRRTAWFYRLKIRDFPHDNNINLKPSRALTGAHFG